MKKDVKQEREKLLNELQYEKRFWRIRMILHRLEILNRNYEKR